MIIDLDSMATPAGVKMAFLESATIDTGKKYIVYKGKEGEAEPPLTQYASVLVDTGAGSAAHRDGFSVPSQYIPPKGRIRALGGRWMANANDGYLQHYVPVGQGLLGYNPYHADRQLGHEEAGTRNRNGFKVLTGAVIYGSASPRANEGGAQNTTAYLCVAVDNTAVVQAEIPKHGTMLGDERYVEFCFLPSSDLVGTLVARTSRGAAYSMSYRYTSDGDCRFGRASIVASSGAWALKEDGEPIFFDGSTIMSDGGIVYKLVKTDGEVRAVPQHYGNKKVGFGGTADESGAITSIDYYPYCPEIDKREAEVEVPVGSAPYFMDFIPFGETISSVFAERISPKASSDFQRGMTDFFNGMGSYESRAGDNIMGEKANGVFTVGNLDQHIINRSTMLSSASFFSMVMGAATIASPPTAAMFFLKSVYSLLESMHMQYVFTGRGDSAYKSASVRPNLKPRPFGGVSSVSLKFGMGGLRTKVLKFEKSASGTVPEDFFYQLFYRGAKVEKEEVEKEEVEKEEGNVLTWETQEDTAKSLDNAEVVLALKEKMAEKTKMESSYADAGTIWFRRQEELEYEEECPRLWSWHFHNGTVSKEGKEVAVVDIFPDAIDGIAPLHSGGYYVVEAPVAKKAGVTITSSNRFFNRLLFTEVGIENPW